MLRSKILALTAGACFTLAAADAQFAEKDFKAKGSPGYDCAITLLRRFKEAFPNPTYEKQSRHSYKSKQALVNEDTKQKLEIFVGDGAICAKVSDKNGVQLEAQTKPADYTVSFDDCPDDVKDMFIKSPGMVYKTH